MSLDVAVTYLQNARIHSVTDTQHAHASARMLALTRLIPLCRQIPSPSGVVVDTQLHTSYKGVV